MLKYEKPIVELLQLCAQDILTTSDENHYVNPQGKPDYDEGNTNIGYPFGP